jgi:hypothetical protein
VNGFPLVTDAATLHLPVEAYMPTASYDRSFEIAISILSDECMKHYGFGPDSTPPRPFTATDAFTQSRVLRRYGLLDLDRARTYGYHVELYSEFMAAEQERQRRNELSGAGIDQARNAARDRVLLATDPAGNPVSSYDGRSLPEGGCHGSAMTEVAGSPDAQRADPVADEILYDSWEQSQSDPRLQVVFEKWSRCMAKQGFDYANALEAAKDPRFAGQRPSPTELSTAVADVECSRQENVVGVWFGVESEIQRAAIEKNAEHLAQAKAELQQRAEKINVVLAAGHG